MSAPSWERMTSSTAWRSSVPGATVAIAARSSGFRRGSSSAGMRVNPRSPRRSRSCPGLACGEPVFLPDVGGFAADVSSLRSVVSFGSIAIEPRLDRLPQRVCGFDHDSAIRRGSRRRDDGGEPQLRALLEPPFCLRSRAEAAREADLAEGGDALLHRNAARPRRNGKSDGEVYTRLVDAAATRDVDEDIGLPERDAGGPRGAG